MHRNDTLFIVCTLLLGSCAEAPVTDRASGGRQMRIVSRTPLGTLNALRPLDGQLWGVGSPHVLDDGFVAYRIDPSTGAVVAKVPQESLYSLDDIAGRGPALWGISNVGSDGECDGADDPDFVPGTRPAYVAGVPATVTQCESTAGTIAKIDSKDGRVDDKVDFVDWSPRGIATTHAGLWLSIRENETAYLVRRSAGSERFERIRQADVMSLQTGHGFLWGVLPAGLARLDPVTGAELARASIPEIRSVFVDQDSVWVTTHGEVQRLDALTLKLERRIAIDDPWGIAGDDTSVFVTGFRDHRIYRIDPSSGAVTETVDLGAPPAGSQMPVTTDVVIAEGSAWVLHGRDLVRVQV